MKIKKCKEKQTEIKVAAWDENFNFLGNIDIADLKPGMSVRELGELREVMDTLYEDSEDYLIPVRNLSDTEYMSPLFFTTEPDRNKTAREIFEPVYELITEMAENGYSDELMAKLLRTADTASNEF